MKNKVNILVKMENKENEALSATFETNKDVSPRKITKLSYGIEPPKNRRDEFKNVELVKVEQEGKDVTKHFDLEKDESKVMLNFDEEMARKTVENGGIYLNVIVRKKVNLWKKETIMADNVNTATYYLSMDLPKLNPNEAKKVTRYAVGNSISNNVTVVELVEVKQDGKDVTEHFNLEKDGSKFMLNFDKEMTRKALADGSVHLKVTIRETLEL